MVGSECPWKLKKEGDRHFDEVRVPVRAEKFARTVTKKVNCARGWKKRAAAVTKSPFWIFTSPLVHNQK